MSPLIEYAFYGTLTGIALIVANLSANWLRHALRRRSALKRMQNDLVFGVETVSLRRKAEQLGDNGLLDRARAAGLKLWIQSGGKFSPIALCAASIFAGLAGFLLAQRGLNDIVVSLTVAVALAVGAPLAMLHWASEGRRNAFIRDLPAAMDVLIRSLRAGHPLTTAISLVGRDLPDPLGAEFRLCAQEMTFGLDLETAVTNIADRVGVTEANVLSSAISIQQRSGGNLTEVLSRLATLLRERIKLQAKARALTAEGRFSGLFLSVMPFLMFGLLALSSPTYYGGVEAHPLVAPVLFGTVVWMSLGVFIINRLVNFKP